MKKDGNITSEEKEILKNCIIHVESGEHFITDDAKKFMWILLASCTFLGLISHFDQVKITSFLSWTFDPGIEVSKIIPLALVAVIILAFIYIASFFDARKAVNNKNARKVRDQNITLFNTLTQNIDSARTSNIESPPSDIDTSEIISLEKFSELKALLNTLENSVSKPSISEDFTKTVYDINNEINRLPQINRNTHISKENTERDEFYSNLCKLCEKLKLNLGKENWFETKLSDIQTCHSILNELVQELELRYTNTYNYYLIENKVRSEKFNKTVDSAIAQRQQIIDEMRSYSFSAKTSYLIFFILPGFYCLATIMYGFYTHYNLEPVVTSWLSEI